MSRLALVFALLLAVVGGGVATLLLRPAGLDESRVRAIASEVVSEAPAPAGLDQATVDRMVAEALTRQAETALPQSTAQLDAATLNPMIEDYLLGNPRILERVSAALDAEVTAARVAETKEALVELKAAIYDDPKNIVLGNPNGDVTLVEMFDYNCGYCRQALPDLVQLLEEDPNLKVILKEFPILSQASMEAAQVAVLVADADADYWIFHQSMFTSRGQIDGQTALKVAKAMGLNPLTLELEMETPKVKQVIDTSYRIAQRLGITGTPTFIIGEEVIPGAIGLDQLKLKIANMRACGASVCPATAANAS